MDDKGDTYRTQKTILIHGLRNLTTTKFTFTKGEHKMKKSLLIVIVCVLGLSLLLTACGGGGGGGGPTPIGGVKSDSGGNGRGGGGPAVTVTLKNTNDFEICQAFISPANQDTWGPNILTEAEKVAPGGSLTLGRIASGSYDLKVVNCDGTKEGKMQFTMP
jgi:hypothetical protein